MSSVIISIERCAPNRSVAYTYHNHSKEVLLLPIKIPDSLPARAVLESENIFVMTEHRATTQRIRPLRIAILNLMPLKIVTETQILRCLSNTPIIPKTRPRIIS